MADGLVQETEGSSILSMSDEDLMALDPSTLSAASVETPPAEEEVITEEVPQAEEEQEQTDPATVAEEQPDTKEAVTTDPATTAEEQAAIDYKAEYERILTPFKANGKDIKVGGIDDAITLMQMGANYNKKMAALKPSLKILKLLEHGGLLDESKISYLIDLDKKNPEAITKLLKDSGINPLDIDTDKTSGYTPNTYTVDDREIELDTVLDELKGSPSYTRTLDVVSTKWDAASKQVIANTPQLLKVINDHVDRGIYDLIASEVERERVFGRLNGLSDIEAYRQVGDMIQSRGGFTHLGHQTATPAPKPVIVAPAPKPVDDKLKDKRRAASSTTSSVSDKVAPDFNPLSLSDDAFQKMIQSKFL